MIWRSLLQCSRCGAGLRPKIDGETLTNARSTSSSSRSAVTDRDKQHRLAKRAGKASKAAAEVELGPRCLNMQRGVAGVKVDQG